MPRPYECVRRAWHSDRHQPIRGSVIQEIFRVVNEEVHCLATRKNIEWQEKLPIVVLKAEEIMYSKANYEAEYSDLTTLWARLNDAINTIIPSTWDQSAGQQLLQPCIEAALHLGCTPTRSSRSQRNYSPRCYLTPRTLENNTPVLVSVPNHNDQIYREQKSVFSNNFPPNHRHCAAAPQASTSSATWSININNRNNNNNPIQPDELKLCPVQCVSDYIYQSIHKSSPSIVQAGECDLTLRLGSLVGKNVDRGTASEGKRFKSRLK